MDFIFHRSYRGPVKAVILDWAGTTVDYGSFAPTAVFLKLFESRGIPIKIETARRPMGLMKKDHLRAIAAEPEVNQAWQAAYGHPMTVDEIDEMFEEFVPMQMACLEEYAHPIPGVCEAVEELHRMGIKIGSTTGYTYEMMKILAPAAARNGYTPDNWVSATDVPAGRPHPWMMYRNAIDLGLYPLEAYIKIGDTLPDIEEGLNAGAWTIGLSITGNLLGLTETEVKALSADQLNHSRVSIAAKFYQAGAHSVVDSLWDTLPIIEEISARLAQGERP